MDWIDGNLLIPHRQYTGRALEVYLSNHGSGWSPTRQPAAVELAVEVGKPVENGRGNVPPGATFTAELPRLVSLEVGGDSMHPVIKGELWKARNYLPRPSFISNTNDLAFPRHTRVLLLTNRPASSDDKFSRQTRHQADRYFFVAVRRSLSGKPRLKRCLGSLGPRENGPRHRHSPSLPSVGRD